MDKNIHLALIYGSNREGRFCDTVVNWVAAQTQSINLALNYGSIPENQLANSAVNWAKTQIDSSGEFTLDLIDPADLGLPPRSQQQSPGAEVLALRERLARADGFIVVTPEYNHGYPAALKFLIDSVYSEWQAKPVAFVSYGGLSGGLRAVEQLRQVFAELHAVTLRDTVGFTNAWNQFDSEGTLREPARAEKSMARMLAHLRWWAKALKFARRNNPYAEIAA